MLCLVHQANYLLDQQLDQLEQAFLRDGGFTERLYRARQFNRFNRSNRSYPLPHERATPKPNVRPQRYPTGPNLKPFKFVLTAEGNS